MSKRGDRELLDDIFEAASRIIEYTSNQNYESFLSDHKTQDAVIRNIEIIGEAVKNISNELKNQHPNVSWKDIARIRDKLIHHYFGVNVDIVWNIIEESLPQLITQIKEI